MKGDTSFNHVPLRKERILLVNSCGEPSKAGGAGLRKRPAVQVIDTADKIESGGSGDVLQVCLG
jgi:hypothetical protein